MKRWVWGLLVLVLALAAGGALYWFWPRPPAPSAAELLPGSTLLFVNIPDMDRARAGFANTPAGRLCQEPEIKALLELPRRALWEALGGKVDAPPDELPLLNAIHGEAFFALTRFALLPKPGVRFIVGVDLKDRLMETRAALSYHTLAMRRYNPASQVTNRRLHGVTYHVWTVSPKTRFCYAFLNTMLVATIDEDTLRETIAWFRHQQPQGATSLAASAAFRNTCRRLPQTADCTSFLNVEQITGLLGPLLMLQPQGLATLQKLGRIQGTALGSVCHSNQFVDTGLTTYSSAPPNQASPVTRTSLAFTSTNTMFYMVASVKWETGYQEALDAIASSGVEPLIRAATQFERSLRRQNIRPQQDFFPHLGPETALLAAWRAGTRFPDVALVTQLRDARHLNATMDALKEAFTHTADRPVWETLDNLRILRIGAGLVAPTYCVTNGFLIVASTPDYARELLNHTGNLDANPDYQTTMRFLPGNAASYLYCDTRALVRPLHDVVRAGLGDSAINFPSADCLVRHLTPYASATVLTPQVETTTTVSPLGKPVTLGVGVAGLVFAIQPYLAGLPDLMPALPKMFSDRAVPVPPAENQKAPSQTPAP
jgi:hypothetical protein